MRVLPGAAVPPVRGQVPHFRPARHRVRLLRREGEAGGHVLPRPVWSALVHQVREQRGHQRGAGRGVAAHGPVEQSAVSSEPGERCSAGSHLRRRQRWCACACCCIIIRCASLWRGGGLAGRLVAFQRFVFHRHSSSCCACAIATAPTPLRSAGLAVSYRRTPCTVFHPRWLPLTTTHVFSEQLKAAAVADVHGVFAPGTALI